MNVLLVGLVIALGVAVPAPTAITRVGSLAALRTALDSASPGDRIELADGSGYGSRGTRSS